MRKKIRIKRVRIYLPFVLIFLGFGIVEFRLFQIQILHHEKYKKLAEKEQLRVVTLSPERGIIYDKNGREVAVNIDSFSLYATPGKIQDKDDISRKLAQVLGEDKESILSNLKEERVFVWLARKLSLVEKEKVRKLGLEGIGFIEEKKRLYPERQLMSHVIGWVGLDNQGLAGVEYSYEKELKGKEGKIALKRDARGYYIPFSRNVLREPVAGHNIQLTIDSQIQSIVEQEILRTLIETKAKSVEAIFVNPNTGEIIALANKPSYDPNTWWDFSHYDRRNRTIQFIYEPGSAFKVVTSAALFEEKLIRPDDRIYCSSHLKFGSYTINDWKEFNREMSFLEVLSNSSNVGIIKAAQRMDKDTFYRYIVNFGFGEKSGIDLPGESTGLLKPPDRWYLTDFPCISIGQGIGVTPLQMVMALSAAVNGGRLLRPFVVRRVVNAEGKVLWENKPYLRKKVISETTSEILRGILGYVVSEGTGKKAKIAGYTIGGKTGTAQIPSPNGGYFEGRYVASFMGFSPVDAPQIAGIVVVKEPTGVYWGGEVAAPLFGRILSRIAPLLGIFPEKELWVKR